MTVLNADQRLAVAVIECLTSLSDRNLNQLRSGREDPLRFGVLIPRKRVAELIKALEAAHPGVLDRTLELERRGL